MTRLRLIISPFRRLTISLKGRRKTVTIHPLFEPPTPKQAAERRRAEKVWEVVEELLPELSAGRVR